MRQRAMMLLAGSALALLVAGAGARQDGGGGQGEVVILDSKGAQPAPAGAGVVVSVEFGGGSIREFVEALKRGSARPINVVMPGEASEMTLPAISLKNVPVLSALRSLEFVFTRESGESQLFRVSMIDKPAGAEPVYVLEMLPRATIFSEPTVTRSYSVRDLLSSGPEEGAGMSLEQVVQSIEAALSLDAEVTTGRASRPPAKVVVHRESNLVLVKGYSRQVDVAGEVVEKLGRDVAMRRKEAKPGSVFEEELGRLRKEREVNIKDLERISEETKSRLGSLAQRRKDAAQPGEVTPDSRQIDKEIELLTESLRNTQIELDSLRISADGLPERALRNSQFREQGGDVARLRQEVEKLRNEVAALRAAGEGKK